MSQSVTAIIITHNSEKYIVKCVEKLRSQSYPIEEIIIVDSGSLNQDYLNRFRNDQDVQLIAINNVGFARANNVGFKQKGLSSDFLLLLNPDTFLDDDFVKKSVVIMNRDTKVGLLSGRLLGFDISNNRGTGKIDSTGIFRKFYGRWYDRGHNETDSGQFSEEEYVPALCGALLFCRIKALKCFNDKIFDPDFFLYKEDIDFSLRIRKQGWNLLYTPDLIAYHCRGWSRRENVPYLLRKKAAESEILLYKKHPSPYIIWALLKYVAVVLMRM